MLSMFKSQPEAVSTSLAFSFIFLAFPQTAVKYPKVLAPQGSSCLSLNGFPSNAHFTQWSNSSSFIQSLELFSLSALASVNGKISQWHTSLRHPELISHMFIAVKSYDLFVTPRGSTHIGV